MPSTAPDTRTSGATGREGVARWSRWAAALALVAVVGLGVAFEFRYVANSDVAWLLTAGRRMSGGARPYSSALVEVNPPLILELSEAAARVEQWTSWPALSVFRGFVGAQALFLSFISFRLLERAAGERRHPLLLAAAPMIAAAFACLPSQDFAEREHLIAMWSTPAVLLIAARLAGVTVPRATALVAGALAALAVCVKPQYLPVPAALGLAMVVARQRRAYPEILAFFGTGLAYAVYAALAYPEYFSTGIPLALTVYVPQTSSVIKVIDVLHVVLIGGAMAACAAAWWWGIRSTAGPMLTLAGLAAYGVHLAVRKGWTYQFLPAKIWLALAIGVVLLDGASRLLAGWTATRGSAQWQAQWQGALLAATLVAMVVGSAGWSAYRYRRHVESAHYRTTMDFLTAVPAGASMANLSPFLFPAFPVAELERQTWDSRYSCLWMLPFTWRPDLRADPATRLAVRRDVSAAVSEDLARSQPRFVLLDRVSTAEVIDVLDDTPAFAAIWQHYRVTHSVDGIDVYERRD